MELELGKAPPPDRVPPPGEGGEVEEKRGYTEDGGYDKNWGWEDLSLKVLGWVSMGKGVGAKEKLVGHLMSWFHLWVQLI